MWFRVRLLRCVCAESDGEGGIDWIYCAGLGFRSAITPTSDTTLFGLCSVCRGEGCR
jgi:hypothetical protein